MFLTPQQQQKQLGRHLQAMPNYSTVWMMVPVVTVVVPQRTVIAVMLMRQGTREQKCASVRREEAASRLLTAASTVRTLFLVLGGGTRTVFRTATGRTRSCRLVLCWLRIAVSFVSSCGIGSKMKKLAFIR